MLWTSETKGTCFIETKNLDGETNLKTKVAKKEMMKIFGDPDVNVNFIIQKRISLYPVNLVRRYKQENYL